MMHCVCDLLPQLSVKTEVVVIRHRKERLRSSNTGGILARVTGGRVVEYGANEEGGELPLDWLDERCVLVYPWGVKKPLPDRAKLILLDGTWRQVRRMYQRIPGLPSLPVVSLGAGGREQRMRVSTVEGGISTLEAGALALGWVEGEEIAQSLLQLFDRMTERQLRLRGVWKDSLG